MEGWGVGEGVDFFAAAQAEDGSTDEEKWDVGAYFGGQFEAVGAGKCET
jgi:hypothetical protein